MNKAEQLMWNMFIDYLTEKHPEMALWIDSECELKFEPEVLKID